MMHHMNEKENNSWTCFCVDLEKMSKNSSVYRKVKNFLLFFFAYN